MNGVRVSDRCFFQMHAYISVKRQEIACRRERGVLQKIYLLLLLLLLLLSKRQEEGICLFHV